MAVTDLPQWKHRAPGEPGEFFTEGSPPHVWGPGLSERSGMSEEMTREEKDLENTWSDPDGR